MKPREPRRKVIISARIRDGAGWSSASILNISSRGLLLHAPKTPRPGAYVEVAKGPHHIVARVVWVKQNHFGVCTQDMLPVAAMTAGVDAGASGTVEAAPERRLKRPEPTASERLERSRRRASAMQFLWIAGISVAGGAVAFEAVKGALSRPLSAVSAELTRKS